MNDESTFKAIADGSRRTILQVLARNELNVSELVECLAIPQSTVSRHLKVLRNAGLISDRRQGTASFYFASAPRSENGDERDRLATRLFDWIRQEPLSQSIERRLLAVVAQREEGDDGTAFFSRVAGRWDQMRVDAFGDTFHRDSLARLLPSVWVVADIGTGTGYLLPNLARLFRTVIAVDPVMNMLDIARRRCDREKLENIDFRQGDLSQLPIAEGAVDAALAVLVLHHVSEPADALGELFRILKPGGQVLIVEQTAHRYEAFHERMNDRWWGFNSNQLRGEVAAAGFERVNVQALEAVGRNTAKIDTPDLFSLTARRPMPRNEVNIETRGERVSNGRMVKTKDQGSE